MNRLWLIALTAAGALAACDQAEPGAQGGGDGTVSTDPVASLGAEVPSPYRSLPGVGQPREEGRAKSRNPPR